MMKLDPEVYSPKVTRYSDTEIVIRVNNVDAVRLLSALNAMKTLGDSERSDKIKPDEDLPTSITHNNFIRNLSKELVGEDVLDGDPDDGGFGGKLPAYYVRGSTVLDRDCGLHPKTKEFVTEQFPAEEEEDA